MVGTSNQSVPESWPVIYPNEHGESPSVLLESPSCQAKDLCLVTDHHFV